MSDTREFSTMAHLGSETSARSHKTDSTDSTVSSAHPDLVVHEDNKLQSGAPLPSQYGYRTPDRPEFYEHPFHPNTIPLLFGQLRQVDGPSTIPQVERLWTATQRIETYSGDHHLPHLRDARVAQLPLNPIREPRLPGPVPRFGLRSMSPLQAALHDLHLSTAPDTPTPAPNFFRPMEKVNRSYPQAPSPTWPSAPTPASLSAEQVRNMLNGFSKDYKGKNTLRNMSANIPNSENCSVFIVGLPPSLTTNRLLSHVRGVGRIYATVINAPDPSKEHYCSAAKIVFFEKAAALRFYQKCELQGFSIDGYKARVVWNRVKSAEQTGSKTRSRVLQIVGPAEFVNSAALTSYFHMKLEFQVDEILMIAETPETNIIEYRFGSYRCQAEAAKMALEREMGDAVKVYFGRDPCDVE